MKQNRALSTLLFGSLAREKRLGLGALALLFLSLGLLVLSQRPWHEPQPNPGASSGTVVTPAPGNVTGTKTGTGTNTATGANTGTTTPPAPPTPPVEVAPSTLAYPLDGDVFIVQSFHSVDTAYGDLRYFDAVAWRASLGQTVRSAAKGRVLQVSSSPGELTQVWIDHGGGMVTRYGGLAMTLVSEGAVVNGHQAIGEVGPATEIRARTGPHLTFAVALNGATVDPNLYLRK